MTDAADTRSSCPDDRVRPVLQKILTGFLRGHSDFPNTPRPDPLLCSDTAAPVAAMRDFLATRTVEEIARVGLGNNAGVSWDPPADAQLIIDCLARGLGVVIIADEKCDFFRRTVSGGQLTGRGARLF